MLYMFLIPDFLEGPTRSVLVLLFLFFIFMLLDVFLCLYLGRIVNIHTTKNDGMI
jgi:hypothetical protein